MRLLHHRTVTAAAAIGVLRRHTHSWSEGDGWRWCRAVGRASWAGVVLGAAPAKTNTRVADRVALHLVDGHFGSVALYKLNETASLARRDLDVCDFAKTLEEGAELVLGDVAGQTTNENSCCWGR